MNSCKSCGSPIPKGQRLCSMCYGDPYYGNDGYYLSFLEQQDQENYEKQRGEYTLQEELEQEQQEDLPF